MGNLRHKTVKETKIQGFPLLKFHVPISLQMAMLGFNMFPCPSPRPRLSSAPGLAMLLRYICMISHWTTTQKITPFFKKIRALNSVLKIVLLLKCFSFLFLFFNYTVALAGIHGGASKWQQQQSWGQCQPPGGAGDLCSPPERLIEPPP